MKFKRLLLHGFKSFVDKTSLDFPDGITAIVGPNGSGKSNIVDAVRWVFGEQSVKELRGADMEDIVFNGSAKRKPAGFAEVSLTLSDIDEAIASKYGTFSDITVTRKFYRSGEREYYINNRKCRLKDIKDIFMDTGLGARSISIIEQGKVDKIINASPEELRFFLEETAGVTKFKNKKRDAEKRLSQTRENLDRLNDIITEVFERLETLSSQLEKLKLSEELQQKKRSLEKQFLSVTYSNKLSEESSTRSSMSDKKIELTTYIKEHTDIMSKISGADMEYIKLEEENKSLQDNRLYAATAKIKAEAESKNLQDKLNNVENNKLNLQEDIEREKNILTSLQSDQKKLELELEKVVNSKDGIDEKVAMIEEVISDIKLSKEIVDEEFSTADNEFISVRAKISEKREDVARSESRISNYTSNIERLKNEQKETDGDINSLNNDISTSDNQISKISSDLKEIEEYLSTKRDEHIKLKETIDFYRIKQSELSGELKNIKSNIEFLESEILSFTLGSGNESKVLKSFKSKLLIEEFKEYSGNNLIELSDIILFEDKDYDEVMKTISLLKVSARFTFRSKLEAIRSAINSSTLEDISQDIYVLNNIYKKIGDDDKGSKIIKIKEKILKDTDQMSIINDELESSNDILEDMLGNLSVLDKEIAESDDTLRLTRDLYTKYITEIESIKLDQSRKIQRLIVIDADIKQAESELSLVESDMDKIRLDLDIMHSEQLVTEESRASLLEKQNFIIRELEDKREEGNEIKREQSVHSERVNSIQRELNNVNNRYHDSETTLSNLDERFNTLVNIDEIAWRKELINLVESIKQLQINVLSIEENLKQSQDSLDNLRQETEQFRVSASDKNKLIHDKESEINRSEVSLASIKTYIETIYQQYLEKFAADINDEYNNYLSDSFEPNKAKVEITRLESELEKLGPINLNAANDFNESDERYKFLTSQRDDLESSISDINIFINETDGATTDIFEKTFLSVREKFTYVFNILFGNGESELRLTDPDNILTSGIEIFIQPPGKKLQHMGLLSGGEKALVALTLLFALFLQKPTPFCFLDEVDAPLDDANVERYTNMVRTISDKTQFILITHNHNTMAVADSLYGIKMQESGVSSILSVKLEHTNNISR